MCWWLSFLESRISTKISAMKLKFTLALCMAATILSSCKKLASDGMDSQTFSKEIKEFIGLNGWGGLVATDSLSSAVDLYIDYSTCVDEAKNSVYYRTVHPVIVDMNPNYYSIKGPVISFETNDRQKVYQLLNSVHEVNYADIKGAVERIVNGKNHAVLITDGEYFMQGNVRDNLNNPYLAAPFRQWLKRGFDIYIYCEPYVESGRFDKFRYYMFFTDDNVSNNIRERFDRSAPAQSDVKMFHLSGKRLQAARMPDYPVVNVSLSLNGELECAGRDYDVQEYYTDWEKIYQYVLENAYDEDGEQLEDGDFVVRGLFFDNGPSNSYKVDDLKIVAYNIGEDFENFKLAKINGENPAKCTGLQPLELFTYDEDLFEETGEIALYLDKDNQYDGLDSYPNLLKVDIVAGEAEENISGNEEMGECFRWQSISGAQSGKYNTSIYESIRQVLLDPSMNPVNRGEDVLYTIYMSTYSL